MPGQIDLHIHTTASDGTDTPRQAVELAAKLGLAAIAITDHDSVFGVAEACAAGRELGVEVVPGIEISADYKGNHAHILGLFIDLEAPSLRPALDWAVNEREARNEKIVGAMEADGLPISLAALRREYPNAVLGRPHMAEHLMKHGIVSSVKEAFDRYLADGKPYYRPRERMPMDQAIDAIRQAGGIAILAHPMQYGYDAGEREAFIQAGIAAGAAGLEAYYSEHSPSEQAELLDTAARYGLAVSGGSDYHGARKPHIAMGSGIEGSLDVPFQVLEALKTLIHQDI